METVGQVSADVIAVQLVVKVTKKLMSAGISAKPVWFNNHGNNRAVYQWVQLIVYSEMSNHEEFKTIQ